MSDLERLRGLRAPTRRDLQVIEVLERRERQVAEHLEGVRFGAYCARRPDVVEAAERLTGRRLDSLLWRQEGELFGDPLMVGRGFEHAWVGLSVTRERQAADLARRSSQRPDWCLSRDGVPYVRSEISVWHGYLLVEAPEPENVRLRVDDLLGRYLLAVNRDNRVRHMLSERAYRALRSARDRDGRLYLSG